MSIVKGFKGFDKDMKCRDFQFKEGETYKHKGGVKACNSGFHFCENPIDIFSYYEPGVSVFHEVTGSGKIHKHGDTKVACSEINVGLSLSLHDLIGAGIKFFFNRKYEETTSNHATGDSSASSATGDSSASSATGHRSASSVDGLAGAAIVTGSDGKAKAGAFGCIALAHYNMEYDRYEMRCAEVGCGDGSDGKLKADTWYKLDDAGFFVGA